MTGKEALSHIYQQAEKYLTGYRRRIILSMLVFLVIIFVPLLLYGILTDRNILQKNVENNGRYLVRNLALNSETGVFSENISYLKIPHKAILQEPDAVWAAVYNIKGELIYSEKKIYGNNLSLPEDITAQIPSWGNDELKKQIVKSGESEIADFYAPIYLRSGEMITGPEDEIRTLKPGEMIGLARVGVSLDALEQRTMAILKTAAILLFICLGAGIFAILFVARSITRPVRELSGAVQKIGSGKMDTRISFSAHDEIGDLGQSFNAMADQLQQQIHERVRAEEEVKTKNKELENYLYITSHDLRSPLVNIQGFSQRLQKQAASIKKLLSDLILAPDTKKNIDKITDEDMPRTLNFILSSVTKMDVLLNGLLQISHTGHTVMTIKKIDMNQLCKTVLGTYDHQLTELGAIVTIGELPACHGDENLLNQMISNIIGNAIKYREKGKTLAINISADQGKNKIIYAIKDNGIGIDPRHLTKIWNVFYRVDSPSGDAGEGLGLNIVQRIVDKHKGRVWAESELGKGSVFFIELQSKDFQE